MSGLCRAVNVTDTTLQDVEAQQQESISSRRYLRIVQRPASPATRDHACALDFAGISCAEVGLSESETLLDRDLSVLQLTIGKEQRAKDVPLLQCNLQ